MISFGSAIVQWFRLHLPSYKSGVQIPSHLCIFHGLKYQYYYLSFEFVIEMWEWTLPLNLKTYGIKLLWNLFFKNGPTPASFVYFRSFQTNIVTIFTTNKCEKCPSSIWCRDSNSQPSDYESPLLTTRPGLPPCYGTFYPKPFCINLGVSLGYGPASYLACVSFMMAIHSESLLTSLMYSDLSR